MPCEPAIPVDQLPRLPVFSGKSQHWSVVVNTGSAATAPTEELMLKIFQTWLPLFGADASVGLPIVAGTEDLAGAPDRLPPLAGVEPPPLQVRGEATIVSVRFDYEGSARSIRWPTYRDQIPRNCPVAQLDAMPVAVGNALPLFRNERLDAPTPPALEEQVLDGVELPDPTELGRQLKKAAEASTTILLGIGAMVAIGGGIYLMSRAKRRR